MYIMSSSSSAVIWIKAQSLGRLLALDVGPISAAAAWAARRCVRKNDRPLWGPIGSPYWPAIGLVEARPNAKRKVNLFVGPQFVRRPHSAGRRTLSDKASDAFGLHLHASSTSRLLLVAAEQQTKNNLVRRPIICCVCCLLFICFRRSWRRLDSTRFNSILFVSFR